MENKHLLLLDGHASHTKNLEAIRLARDNGVTMLSFPPHEMQPLDVSFFRSEHTRARLFCPPSELMNASFLAASTMSTTVNGFRKVGIWSCNRHVFDGEFNRIEYLQGSCGGSPSSPVQGSDDGDLSSPVQGSGDGGLSSPEQGSGDSGLSSPVQGSVMAVSPVQCRDQVAGTGRRLGRDVEPTSRLGSLDTSESNYWVAHRSRSKPRRPDWPVYSRRGHGRTAHVRVADLGTPRECC